MRGLYTGYPLLQTHSPAIQLTRLKAPNLLQSPTGDTVRACVLLHTCRDHLLVMLPKASNHFLLALYKPFTSFSHVAITFG